MRDLAIEIVDGVLFDKNGNNVNDAMDRAISAILERVRDEEIACAILKSRSPTCGVNQIYDGSFTGTRISGSGVFAQALKEAGIPVIDVEDLGK